MIRQPIPLSTRIGIGVMSIVVLLGVYEFLAYRQTQQNPDQTSVPSIVSWGEGWNRMTTTNARGECWLWEDAKATYGRLFMGLGAGIALSIVVGVAMGAYTWVEAFFCASDLILGEDPPHRHVGGLLRRFRHQHKVLRGHGWLFRLLHVGTVDLSSR